MTTWDKETIDNVSRLYVKVAVSLEVEHQPGTADAIHARAARALQAEARTFAVEIHPDDVRTRRGAEDDTRMTVEYVAHWQPTTGRCQLLGGASDGTMYDTTLSPHEPLRVAYQIGLASLAEPDETSATVAIAPGVDLYEVVGWSEEGRYWVRAVTRPLREA